MLRVAAQIIVDLEDGSSLVVEAAASDSVLELKQELEDLTSLPLSSIALAFQGQTLDNGLLGDYGERRHQPPAGNRHSGVLPNEVNLPLE